MFPGSCSDTVHITGGQNVSVGRLLRCANRPLWFVTEELGVDLIRLRKSDWDSFNDFFDELISSAWSHIRVRLSNRLAVLTGGCIVRSSNKRHPSSHLSSVSSKTLRSVFADLPFAGLTTRIGAFSFSFFVPFIFTDPSTWNTGALMNQRTRLCTTAAVI